MRLWPWSQFAELEATIQLQAREMADLQETLRIAVMEKDSEVVRRVSAEALAADRKQALERAMADIVTAANRAEAAQDKLVNALVEANLRLSAAREEKPPDMEKIRQMMPMGEQAVANPMQRARAMGRDIDRLLMAKFYPNLVAMARPKAAPTEGPPPGADERPSLGAAG